MEKTKHRTELFILSALFVIYLILLFRITIFRGSDSGVPSANLIPFATIFEYLHTILRGTKLIGISNILGNLIMFLPLGYMTALLTPNMRKLKRIFILSAAFSLVIEACQYILARGTADIDDVILNVLGAVAGCLIYSFISRFASLKKYAALISASMIAFTCIGFISYNNYKFLLPMPGNPPAYTETLNSFSGPLTANNIDTSGDSNVAAQSDSDDTAWKLILVNKWNPMPDDYYVELIEFANGQSVDKRIYPALLEMLNAAESDGVYPIVVSGYRTAETQGILMDEKIAEYKSSGSPDEKAVIQAQSWVAIPGASEHQLGIAVDINADGIHSYGHEVYEWMGQNAHKYGFIRRYPDSKTEITGVSNEPWHYRYVGIPAATEIYNQGVCLEEYLCGTK